MKKFKRKLGFYRRKIKSVANMFNFKVEFTIEETDLP